MTAPVDTAPLQAPAPAAKRRKPPPILIAVLGAGVAAGLWLDWLGNGWVTAVSARVEGPVVNAAAGMPGTLAEVRVEEGQRVKAGEVVARIGDADVRQAMLQAEADLAGAQAGLSASRTGVSLQGATTANNVAQARASQEAARAAVTAADAAVRQAQADYERLRGLQAGGYIAGQELEAARVRTVTTRADAAAARARLTGADEALRHARATGAEEAVRRDGVDAGTAQLRRAQAQLALAKLRLSAAAIAAPIDGLVVRRLADPGEPVTLGEPILAVVDPRRLWVTAYLDELAVPRVAEGAAAVVRFDALPGRRFDGKVAFVAAVTDDAAVAHAQPRTGAERLPPRVPVRVALATTDPALRPGMTATVRIQASR